jgi:hypothetical protein
MKKFIISLFLLVACLSCEKYSIPDFPENPAWLEERIAEIKSGTNYGIKIDVYFWKEAYYYHILNIISSCHFCEFYDYEGVKTIWQETEMEDFFKTGKRIGTVWSSPPYSHAQSRKPKIETFRNSLDGIYSADE